MATWPPALADLKKDMDGDVGGADDPDRDARLTQVLDAAVAFVERARGGEVNFAGTDPLPVGLDPVTDDLVLGTLRLAARYNTRRRSPDLLIDGGDLGTSRVPGGDPDIERLLRVGRYAKARFA